MIIISPSELGMIIDYKQINQLNLNMLDILETDIVDFKISEYDADNDNVTISAGIDNAFLTTHENFIKSINDPENKGNVFYIFNVYAPYKIIYDSLDVLCDGGVFDVGEVLNPMMVSLENTKEEPHGDRALAAGKYIMNIFSVYRIS